MSLKTARLDLRLTEDQYALLTRAASISGSSLAGYSIASLMDVAAASVAQARAVTLSDADWAEFTAALDAPDGEAWARLRALDPAWAS